mgnify:CR=1 FL=1
MREAMRIVESFDDQLAQKEGFNCTLLEHTFYKLRRPQVFRGEIALHVPYMSGLSAFTARGVPREGLVVPWNCTESLAADWRILLWTLDG